MAGDWIKLQHVTPDKPEVFRMAIELGVTPEHVLGCLCRLWIWADQQTIDGHGVCVTGVTLNRITCHAGFSDALQNVGWLSGDELNFTLPNFERHNGETAKTRALATKRKEKQRHAETVTGVTLKTRPEKRREEMFTTSDEVVVVSKLPTCPQQEILTLYGEILPDLPQPRIWDGARATNLTARWKAVLSLLAKSDKPATQGNGIEYFRQVFILVRKSDFLMGRKTEWTASLGWIVKSENFAKIIDGNYDSS
jgi:hypothetical protein